MSLVPDNPFLGLFFSPVTEAQDMMIQLAPHHDILHFDGGHKHEENSRRGINLAAQEKKWGIDLDNRKSKSGKSWNTHWGEPIAKDGFIDPEHKMGPHKQINTMTDAEVMRLVTPGDHYVIRSTTDNTNFATKQGLHVLNEMKCYYSYPEIVALRATFEHPEMVWFEALATFPWAASALTNATRAGFTTKILWHPGERNHPLPVSAKHTITYMEPGVKWRPGT